jgi:hypothetical protein
LEEAWPPAGVLGSKACSPARDGCPAPARAWWARIEARSAVGEPVGCGGVAECFVDFVQHYKLLQLAWDQNQDQSEVERCPFPDQFDRDLSEAIYDIKCRLDDLVITSSGANQDCQR